MYSTAECHCVIMSLWLYWHSPEAHIIWALAKFYFKFWQSCLFPVAFWRSKISYMQFTREGLFRKDPKPRMLSAIYECNDLPSLFRSVLFEKLICENCAPTLVPYFTSHSVILLLLAIQTQKCPNESHSMKFCLKCDVLHRCPFRFLSGRP